MNSRNSIILCVDDEEANLKLFENMLVPRGYTVVCAASGEEALLKIKSQPIDLIILDIVMPGMNGFEVCRQIKEDQKHRSIPVIMITASTAKEDRIRGIEAGAEEFLSKPFDQTEVLVRIKILLKGKELNDDRDYAEETLQKSHDALDHQVQERTAELAQANQILRRQLENMTALRDIGSAIGSSLDLRTTLNILLDKVMAQLNVDAADVLLLDTDTLYLNFSAGLGFRTSAIQNTHVRLGKGHVGQVAFERKTLIVPDLSETLTHALDGEEFRSYVAMPLVAHGKIQGVIEIFQRSLFNPSPEWLNFLELISGQAAIAIDNSTLFDSLQRSNMELILSYDATLEGWGRALEFRDAITKGHTERVTEMTMQLARLMGVNTNDLVHIRRGALLHDVGKIHLPDSILLKPGRLTQEEQLIMQRHPVYAHDLLSPIPFLRPALDIPYCHHEKWDGSGYPRGLKADYIPYQARIFSVIDVADALLSNRPYREAWSQEKTHDYIKSQKGIYFAPDVVEAFLEMKWK